MSTSVINLPQKMVLNKMCYVISYMSMDDRPHIMLMGLQTPVQYCSAV